MKAGLDSDGKLWIRPETGTDVFALEMWARKEDSGITVFKNALVEGDDDYSRVCFYFSVNVVYTESVRFGDNRSVIFP